MKVSDPPVIIKQEFPYSLAIVWDAITQHQKMKKWFFILFLKVKYVFIYALEFNLPLLLFVINLLF